MEHGPAREAAALPRLMREELARWAGARAVAWKDDGVGEAEAVTDVPAVATATTAAATAATVAAAAVPFRGGYVGFFGYEAWRWLGPASAAPELRAARDGAAGGAASESAEARERPGAKCGKETSGLHEATKPTGGEGGEEPPSGEADEGVEPGGRGAAGAVDEAAWMFADRLLAFDHTEGRLHLLCLYDSSQRKGRESAEAWMRSTSQALRRMRAAAPHPTAPLAAPPVVAASASAAPPSSTAPPPAPPPAKEPLSGFVPARPEATYQADIAHVFEALRRGDSYEVRLPTRCDLACTSSAPRLHLAGRFVSPRRCTAPPRRRLLRSTARSAA